MAETFLYYMGKSVLGKLASLALEEFFLASGLQSDIEKIKKTMVAINAVLLNTEQRQSQNHAIEAWLRMIKDVFYDIEDVVDEFECEALRRQVVRSGMTARKVRQFCSKSNPFVFRIQMVHMLKNIRERLVEIAALKASFGLTEGVNDMPNIIHRERALTHSFVRKEDVFGREDDKKNIINARYLSLFGNDKLKRPPNSICKLQNLKMLDLGECYQLEDLPGDTKDLMSLRCLQITTSQKHLPKGRNRVPKVS